MEAIVPDVLDVAPPSGKLEVKYPTGVVVQTGNELTPTQVKDEPSVSWAAESTDALYTLLMVDPDAPSRAQPTFREILHWAVVNIVGNQLASGDTLAEYVGSGPPEGTGLHRYIFLLYRQSARVEEDMRIGKRTRDGRFNFSVRKFAAKHGLGQPIAGSFYEAQYDDYVAIRNKEFAK
ncbi:phosphatidylethanolamine-binding protein homolog F40A3.3 [Drosophila busckii]|uniref:phosphatidylethanolamine-binding protein homolog F40A3.3 n=1 Tax=Drosophila busckii TaxID=30019 RepID=UPI00083E9FC3|nr:phosphatidylethanolamine-binding protein homolog F40A3.3 [Drosophila busckii]